MSKSSGARVKGSIQNVKSGRRMDFLFNPTNFNPERTMNYKEISAPGTSYPKLQYVSGGLKRLNFDIFLYGENGEVNTFINFMNDLMPREKSGIRWGTPPTLIFAYGWYVKECVLESFREDYYSFRPSDLRPRMAVMTVTLVVVA